MSKTLHRKITPRARLGARLRRAREALGLSQADVCRRAGVAANAYNQWEKGRRLINVFDAIKLADALGLSLDHIYRGDDTEVPPSEPRPADDGWSENTSTHFVDYGDYFVPGREAQTAILCRLVADLDAGGPVVDLCCGEGLLSAALLDRLPGATVHAHDGSPTMLAKTRERLAAFAGRFETRLFDLAATDWRRFPEPVRAFVSSLAIHHLDGAAKAALYADLARALAPGGMIAIADLIAPATATGRAIAAEAWDAEVRRRALERDGDLAAFTVFRDDRWNYYADPEPDPIDQPSPLIDQLRWLEDAGLVDVEVHWLLAGHAVFSARKPT